MLTRLESIILQSLLYNPEYAGKVLPHLDSAYFREPIEQAIFSGIETYQKKYGEAPSIEQLLIRLDSKEVALSQEEYDRAREYLTDELGPATK
jgi:replicative DNA helicase